MAEESIDSGLSSEQSQTSKEQHHCYPPTPYQQQTDGYLQSQPECLLDPQKYPPNQFSRYCTPNRTPTGDQPDHEDTEDTVAERPPDVLANKPLADLYSRMSGGNGNCRTGYNAPRDRQRFPIPSQQSQSQQQQQQHHQQSVMPQASQQQTPRVHFGLGNRSEPPYRRGPPMGHMPTPLSRNLPENAIGHGGGISSTGGNYRPRPPFVRSLSSKAFELVSDTSPSSVKSPRRFRASSPPVPRWPSELEGNAHFFQTMQQLERTFPDVLDKGIQCERDSSIQGSPKTTTILPMNQTTSSTRGFVSQQPQSPPQTNPLLSALLAAAANATMNLSEQPAGAVTARRALRPHFHGSLPYWSDTEISPYDTLEALTSTAQPAAAKPYPPVAAASAVAAAAAAAAAAMAAVQSTTSRVPRPGPMIVPPTAVPVTSAKSLEGTLPSQISRAALQLSQLPLEDYNCLPTAEMDTRQSVLRCNVAGQRPESLVYGRTGFLDSNVPARRPNNMDLVTTELSANAGQRFPIQENATASAGDAGTAPVPGGPVESQELTFSPSSSFTQARRTDATANILASQFNLLSSEPYPLSSEHPLSPQSPRPGVGRDSPEQVRFRPSGATEKRIHSHAPSAEDTAGLLVVNVIAGSGLKTSQMLLRDLYCVLETDSVRKARSMIRTNTDFFEWDEVFEIEIEESRFLSLLVYQWDPRTRHRLCFYGGIDLRSFIRQRRQLLSMNSESEFSQQQQQQVGEPESKPLTSPIVANSAIRFEKIALQLEPKGIMYLQMGILPLKSLYVRRNFTNSYEAGLFGVSLDELMYRNRLLTDLLPPPPNDPLSHAVPLLIRKCVEEVDRRGTDVVGIYRLSGSVWMKLQVRELLTRTADKIIQGISKQNEKAVKVALATLDLSADSVPDIHAITATVKDFFRELPEPLFTNALYPMVYEATQVAGPGDSHMGTKLILNILDCLPTSNQEVLLYLLDHLKRITSKSMVNKMNSHNLAVCLAPVLLHPSPEAAKDMEPSLIESRKMVSILECILDIWP
ncbi:synapse defective 1, Rho GTPase, 2 [Sparganum proliferum]